jgi:hypothetical protein
MQREFAVFEKWKTRFQLVLLTRNREHASRIANSIASGCVRVVETPDTGDLDRRWMHVTGTKTGTCRTLPGTPIDHTHELVEAPCNR